MKRTITTLLMLISLMASFATTYYCKPNGTGQGTSYSDAGDFKSMISVLQAGDILYCLGGQYDYDSQINISCSGTQDNKISIFAYPGEKPVFDFRKEAYGSKGICPKGDYIHIKGLTIRYTGKNGLYNTGSYNIFENLDVYGNGDTGVQMKTGHSNLILNCDSHDNFDYELGGTTSCDFGGNADGFADKQYTGGGNTYRGCRAWRNSDDGWDFFQHVTGDYGETVIDSCICFANGPGEYDMRNHGRYETDKAWFDQFQSPITVTDKRGSTHSCSLEHYVNMGNANGFKLGGGYTVHNVTVQRSLSVYNGNTFNLSEDLGAKGIDQNNNAGVMKIYSCTSYKNAKNIGFDQSTCGTLYMYNTISYKGVNPDVIITPTQTTSNNSWEIEGLSVSDNDFLSTDTTGILAPRNEDGSLPYVALMHLSQNSQLIDRGTIETGLPYYGAAPDLGCYETTEGGKQIPPTLTVTGPKTQTLKAGKAIKSVTVTAGGSSTAISRTDNTDIPGVTVAVDGLTATISGTPTQEGQYDITFVPVTEEPNTLSVTISLTVTSPTAFTIAYVSKGSDGSDAADAKIIESIAPYFAIKYFDAGVTTNNYSDCDALVISPVPGSDAAAISGLKNYNLPTLLLKPFLMKSSVWNWGVAANTTATAVRVAVPTHQIFSGLNLQKNASLELFEKCNTNAVTAISSPTSWSGYKLLAVPSSNTGYISIADLTGATLNETKISQRYIMLGISESSTEYLTAEAQKVITNSLYYILGQTIPSDVTNCIEVQSLSDAIYYDVYGRQIDTPVAGMYIVKQGNKVTKVIR